MFRIRVDSLLHAHIIGDPLSLGTESLCIDQLDTSFQHAKNCISLRTVWGLYSTVNDPSVKDQLKTVITTFETTDGSPIVPISSDDYQHRYRTTVSGCLCSLESCRRYQITGTILNFQQLQAFAQRLIMISGSASTPDHLCLVKWVTIAAAVFGITPTTAKMLYNTFLTTHPYNIAYFDDVPNVDTSEFLMFLFLQGFSPYAPCIQLHTINLTSIDAFVRSYHIMATNKAMELFLSSKHGSSPHPHQIQSPGQATDQYRKQAASHMYSLADTVSFPVSGRTPSSSCSSAERFFRLYPSLIPPTPLNHPGNGVSPPSMTPLAFDYDKHFQSYLTTYLQTQSIATTPTLQAYITQMIVYFTVLCLGHSERRLFFQQNYSSSPTDAMSPSSSAPLPSHLDSSMDDSQDHDGDDDDKHSTTKNGAPRLQHPISHHLEPYNPWNAPLPSMLDGKPLLLYDTYLKKQQSHIYDPQNAQQGGPQPLKPMKYPQYLTYAHNIQCSYPFANIHPLSFFPVPEPLPESSSHFPVAAHPDRPAVNPSLSNASGTHQTHTPVDTNTLHTPSALSYFIPFPISKNSPPLMGTLITSQAMSRLSYLFELVPTQRDSHATLANGWGAGTSHLCPQSPPLIWEAVRRWSADRNIPLTHSQPGIASSPSISVLRSSTPLTTTGASKFGTAGRRNAPASYAFGLPLNKVINSSIHNILALDQIYRTKGLYPSLHSSDTANGTPVNATGSSQTPRPSATTQPLSNKSNNSNPTATSSSSQNNTLSMLTLSPVTSHYHVLSDAMQGQKLLTIPDVCPLLSLNPQACQLPVFLAWLHDQLIGYTAHFSEYASQLVSEDWIGSTTLSNPSHDDSNRGISSPLGEMDDKSPLPHSQLSPRHSPAFPAVQRPANIKNGTRIGMLTEELYQHIALTGYDPSLGYISGAGGVCLRYVQTPSNDPDNTSMEEATPPLHTGKSQAGVRGQCPSAFSTSSQDDFSHALAMSIPTRFASSPLERFYHQYSQQQGYSVDTCQHHLVDPRVDTLPSTPTIVSTAFDRLCHSTAFTTLPMTTYKSLRTYLALYDAFLLAYLVTITVSHARPSPSGNERGSNAHPQGMNTSSRRSINPKDLLLHALKTIVRQQLNATSTSHPDVDMDGGSPTHSTHRGSVSGASRAKPHQTAVPFLLETTNPHQQLFDKIKRHFQTIQPSSKHSVTQHEEHVVTNPTSITIVNPSHASHLQDDSTSIFLSGLAESVSSLGGSSTILSIQPIPQLPTIVVAHHHDTWINIPAPPSYQPVINHFPLDHAALATAGGRPQRLSTNRTLQQQQQQRNGRGSTTSTDSATSEQKLTPDRFIGFHPSQFPDPGVASLFLIAPPLTPPSNVTIEYHAAPAPPPQLPSPVAITHVTASAVSALFPISYLTISHCSDTSFEFTTATSVKLMGLRNCTITVCCRHLTLSACHNVTIYGLCLQSPLIHSTCTNITVAPYNLYTPDLPYHLAMLGIKEYTIPPTPDPIVYKGVTIKKPQSSSSSSSMLANASQQAGITSSDDILRHLIQLQKSTQPRFISLITTPLASSLYTTPTTKLTQSQFISPFAWKNSETLISCLQDSSSQGTTIGGGPKKSSKRASTRRTSILQTARDTHQLHVEGLTSLTSRTPDTRNGNGNGVYDDTNSGDAHDTDLTGSSQTDGVSNESVGVPQYNKLGGAFHPLPYTILSLPESLNQLFNYHLTDTLSLTNDTKILTYSVTCGQLSAPSPSASRAVQQGQDAAASGITTAAHYQAVKDHLVPVIHSKLLTSHRVNLPLLESSGNSSSPSTRLEQHQEQLVFTAPTTSLPLHAHSMSLNTHQVAPVVNSLPPLHSSLHLSAPAALPATPMLSGPLPDVDNTSTPIVRKLPPEDFHPALPLQRQQFTFAMMVPILPDEKQQLLDELTSSLLALTSKANGTAPGGETYQYKQYHNRLVTRLQRLLTNNTGDLTDTSSILRLVLLTCPTTPLSSSNRGGNATSQSMAGHSMSSPSSLSATTREDPWDAYRTSLLDHHWVTTLPPEYRNALESYTARVSTIIKKLPILKSVPPSSSGTNSPLGQHHQQDMHMGDDVMSYPSSDTKPITPEAKLLTSINYARCGPKLPPLLQPLSQSVLGCNLFGQLVMIDTSTNQLHMIRPSTASTMGTSAAIGTAWDPSSSQMEPSATHAIHDMHQTTWLYVPPFSELFVEGNLHAIHDYPLTWSTVGMGISFQPSTNPANSSASQSTGTHSMITSPLPNTPLPYSSAHGGPMSARTTHGLEASDLASGLIHTAAFSYPPQLPDPPAGYPYEESSSDDDGGGDGDGGDGDSNLTRHQTNHAQVYGDDNTTSDSSNRNMSLANPVMQSADGQHHNSPNTGDRTTQSQSSNNMPPAPPKPALQAIQELIILHYYRWLVTKRPHVDLLLKGVINRQGYLRITPQVVELLLRTLSRPQTPC